MNDADLMVTVARLYYNEGITQEKIAHELGLTRMRVIGLLKRARTEGIVQFRIVHPGADFAQMERRLKEKYGLLDALIVPSIPDNAALLRKSLGKAAGAYLNKTLESRDVLGIGWGHSVLETAESLQDFEKRSITVVPLIGGGSDTLPQYDINALARRFSQVFGGDCYPLYTLALTDTKEIRDIIVTDSKISRVLDFWGRMNTVLVGIGAMTVRLPDLFDKHLEVEPIDFRSLGIVGDVLFRFFNVRGEEVRLDLSDRMIGTDFAKLRMARRVIGVACGATKYKAILGAVRGKIVNVLITDHDVARKLLEQID